MERPRTRPYAPGGREDCWSEDATSALITAWGDRYLRLNRGNLRQKDWKEVAAVVFKTDGQCKNRIDTLKKKYKLKKSKPFRSPWIFYDTLDSLIGLSPTNTAVSSKPTPKTESEGEEDDDDVDGGVGLYCGAACREVARAISRFGKVYERMERWKQEQMVELEKQRMAFTKELEVSTLNMFMESQLELEKMNKRRKYSHNSSEPIKLLAMISK